MARDAAGKAALTVALKGDLIEASAWLAREAKFPEPEGWLSGVAPVAGNVARATVALGRLDRDAAVAAISKLRRLAPREDYWAFVAVATAQLGLLFGRPTESLHQLRDLQASNEGPVGDGIGPPVLLAAELDLLIAMGRGDRALRMLAETEVDSPQLTVITARLNLLAGIPTDADSVAREALSATHTPRIRLELLLIRAVALNRIGDRAASLRCLAEGLEISDRYELLSPFAGVPRELLKAAVADVPGVAAITAVLDASSVRRVFPERLQLTELTPRELVVLQELAARGSLALISEKLFVSLATLKSQRNSLYRKLGVHTRKEALEQAYERGLL
jgi:LuxR family maltose regulon positive regulatory protein